LLFSLFYFYFISLYCISFYKQKTKKNKTKNKTKQQSGLRIACIFGHLDTVQWLLEMDRTLNMIDSEGEVLLHAAAGSGSLPVVKYVIVRYRNLIFMPGSSSLSFCTFLLFKYD
jgi:hypothetical protein